MKNIDIKSVIIGVLLTTTVFFGMGAAADKSGKEKWNDSQQWMVASRDYPHKANKDIPVGMEPFAVDRFEGKLQVFYRKLFVK